MRKREFGVKWRGMPTVFKLIILVYLAAVVFVHSVPLGGEISLSAMEVVEYRGFELRASDLVHVFVFLPWGFIGFMYLWRRPKGYWTRAFLWIVIGIVLGVAAEGIQYWIAYRSFNLSDMGFNIAGVLLGSSVLFLRAFTGGRIKRPRQEGRRREDLEDCRAGPG